MSAPTATLPKPGQRAARPATPAGLFVRAFVLLSMFWFAVPWTVGLFTLEFRDPLGPPGLVEHAQLRAIRHRLAHGEGDRMNRLFPEGQLFSYAFYGFALVNMSVAEPDDRAFRRHALAELERIIPIVEGLADEEPFRRNSRFVVPPGGIILAGQANLLRAGYAMLGGQREDILAAFHDNCRTLHAAFLASRTGCLESYAGLIWPVDNCCALLSLRLHDHLYGTDYAEACRRWERWMAGHLDAESGMMVAQIDSRGAVEDPPRGCAMSWSLAFMPGFAPDLARTQYAHYRDTWFTHILGGTGIREWSPGRERRMDVDTGPVIGPIGFAATGFGIAAARAQGDAANLWGMLRGLEVFGGPCWTIDGRRNYFFGLILLPDVLALWGRTVCDWTQPHRRFHDWPAVDLGHYWIVLLAVVVIAGGLILLAYRSTASAWRGLRANPLAWRLRHWVVLGLDVAVFAAWLFVFAFPWPLVILLMGLADIVDRRVLAR